MRMLQDGIHWCLWCVDFHSQTTEWFECTFSCIFSLKKLNYFHIAHFVFFCRVILFGRAGD
jgi:hypothetical protein